MIYCKDNKLHICYINHDAYDEIYMPLSLLSSCRSTIPASVARFDFALSTTRPHTSPIVNQPILLLRSHGALCIFHSDRIAPTLDSLSIVAL